MAHLLADIFIQMARHPNERRSSRLWKAEREPMRRLLFVLYAIPTLAVVSASAFLMEPISVVLCGILACALALVATLMLIGLARSKRQRLRPILVAAGICFVSLISVITTHWPLRIRYVLSRPSMERVATEILAGRALDRPTRVGLLTIKKAEVSQSGLVCLWTEPHPGGNTGFVQCGPVGVPFNLWSIVELDRRWQFIAED